MKREVREYNKPRKVLIMWAPAAMSQHQIGLQQRILVHTQGVNIITRIEFATADGEKKHRKA